MHHSLERLQIDRGILKPLIVFNTLFFTSSLYEREILGREIYQGVLWACSFQHPSVQIRHTSNLYFSKIDRLMADSKNQVGTPNFANADEWPESGNAAIPLYRGGLNFSLIHSALTLTVVLANCMSYLKREETHHVIHSLFITRQFDKCLVR